MIYVDVLMKRDSLSEFRVKGHSNYANSGSDIVCSAVSILVYNAVNSCEKFADTLLDVVDTGEEMVCRFPAKKLPERAVVLIQSLVFGIEQLVEQYPEYVVLNVHH